MPPVKMEWGAANVRLPGAVRDSERDEPCHSRAWTSTVKTKSSPTVIQPNTHCLFNLEARSDSFNYQDAKRIVESYVVPLPRICKIAIARRAHTATRTPPNRCDAMLALLLCRP